MTIGRYFRLGWNQPLVNTLTGPDAPNLRRIFQSLQLWLDFPLVGLQGSAISGMAAATSTPVVWSIELYDDYTIHAPNAVNIRVPTQAQRYFAVGAFTASYAGGGTGRRISTWLLNGGGTNWAQTSDTNSINYITCPFLGIVKANDLLEPRVSHNATVVQDIDDTELWMMFLPMGS